MVEESPPEFKFSSDEQDPETFYQQEIKDLQVEKLSQKVTLLTILLPILKRVAPVPDNFPEDKQFRHADDVSESSNPCF